MTTIRPERPGVLVIEDDDATAELLRAALEEQDYAVATVRYGGARPATSTTSTET